jgi:hypothetical protein
MAHDDLPFERAVDACRIDELARHAAHGVAQQEAPVRMARPDVHVDRLVREDGVVLTWFVSYADEAVEVLGPARPA